jgi:hypothetical protein
MGRFLTQGSLETRCRRFLQKLCHSPAHRPPCRTKFLDNLPAIAQQGTTAQPGSPGSCEAQSFGYGLGSYTAARTVFGAHKWDPGLPQNSVSAAYLYALIHQQEGRSCPTGSLALGYLAQLTAYGSPTRARIPYLPECSYLDGIPSSSPDFPDDYPGMGRFRIGSYAAFSIGDNPGAIGVGRLSIVLQKCADPRISKIRSLRGGHCKLKLHSSRI